MKAFVTGGTGFIGRRLVERLVEHGHEVTILTRNADYKSSFNVKIVNGDILMPESIQNIQGVFDIVFHLAAMISFNPSMKKELELVNVQGTLNILEASKRWHASRTVLVSSACTLGVSLLPQVLDEDASPSDEQISRNPYMASKIKMEELAFSLAQEQDIVIVNPTTVYGAGDWSLNSGTLIKKIASSMILPVPPGGSNVIDIDDVVEGIMAAARKGVSGKRYILGGENLSFCEIFTVISRVVSKSPFFVPLPKWTRIPASIAIGCLGKLTRSRFLTRQIFEDMYCYKYYSNKQTQEKLEWQPRYKFEESIKHAWEFYNKLGIITK